MTFLGLDAGGSHCRCEWWPSGQVPGSDAAVRQPAVHGVLASIDDLAAALLAAARVTAPTAAVCAVAGIGDAETGSTVVAGLRQRGIVFPVAVVADVLAAAAAALSGTPGVLLWAGTGSFAVARAPSGELVRVGGRGYLLGDQGSGYDFVRRAAAAVLLAHDDLGPTTLLTQSLPAAFQLASPARLGAALQRLDSGQVAAQLPVVLAAFAQGDAVAADVVAGGVDALVMLAAAAARKVELDWGGLSVAMGGGVLAHARAIEQLVAERLQALGAIPTLLDDRAAARGAAWLAHGWHTHRQPQHAWVTRVAI